MSRTGAAIVRALEGATHAMTPAERAFTKGIRSALEAFDDIDAGSPFDPEIPPGGGKWASEREARERWEATTMSLEEYGRFVGDEHSGRNPNHVEGDC